ncbi:ABC transporter substrate-binding protein [Paenibacillus methanolicus]|uniref:Multiple sugar transport system substrate-binding protein n=1 Tax=Paenibacillus methanolicus TaxID=582686 RepID=A0A5S5C3V8_9BACL|nr:sugar ABC transporter substrate-binding protein [Paenibacillus methanolicus]TYP73172.1 multiple sugar transport system substrate-binding protein [Paenibacillus methanolicus]
MKKWLAGAMGIVLTGTLLSGCGGNAQEEAASGGNAAETEAASTGNAAKEPVTIKFMHWSDTASESMYADLVAAFEAHNPDVNVELVKSDIKTYSEKLTITLTGSSDVDAFAFKDLKEYYRLASIGRVVQLDDQAAGAGDALNGVSHLFDTLKIDGKLYGLPFRNDGWALFYNKNLFDAAGVAYPKDDMTWEAYVALAKQLTQGEGQGKTWGSFMPDWSQTWYGYGQQLGKTLFDEDLAPYLRGLELRKELTDSGAQPTVAENQATNAHYRPVFLAGKTAMVNTGTWFPGMLEQDKKDGKLSFDWGMTYVPHPEGVAKGTSMSTAVVHSVSATSKHKEEAFKWLSFISGDEGQTIVAKYQTPASKADGVKQAFESNFSEGIDMAPIFNMTPVPERNLQAGLPELETIVTEEGNRALLGEITPDEAIASIADRRSKELP